MGSYDIEALKKDFLPKVAGNKSFRDRGYFSEQSGDYYHAVINPHNYALYIWKKGKSEYVETAEALGAAVFTNGPQMKPALEENGKWHVIKRSLKGTVPGLGVVGTGFVIAAIFGSIAFPPAAIVVGIGGALVLVGAGVGVARKDWTIGFRMARSLAPTSASLTREFQLTA